MNRCKELFIDPEWSEIERARNEYHQFLLESGVGKDDIDALVMVISELLENSIKYGVFEPGREKCRVTVIFSPVSILIRVRNPVDENCREHLLSLDRYIQWIRSFQDPFEAYVERLRQVSKKSLSNSESGLGLVRVAYEGRSILDFVLINQNTLEISSSYTAARIQGYAGRSHEDP